MTDTAKVTPINRVREPAGSHLRNALQIALCSMEQLRHRSEQAIASTAPADIVAMRDRVQAAVDIIEEVKALLENWHLMTQSGKGIALARIKEWL